MQLDRGEYGGLPFAATGSGEPVVLLPGLAPVAGVGGDGYARSCLAPLSGLASTRRVVALGRRRNLPGGLTMPALTAEHAEALRVGFARPVDVVGVSTGGSIAQQLAAEHPDVVRSLVLVSTGCRLSADTKAMQAQAGRLAREGRAGRLASLMAGELVPPWRGRTAARWLARALGPVLLRDPAALADLASTVEAEDGFDLASCEATIAAPTVLIAGGQDRFYPQALLEETIRLIPGSRLLRIPGRGHVSVVGDKRCRAAIAGFLSARPG